MPSQRRFAPGFICFVCKECRFIGLLLNALFAAALTRRKQQASRRARLPKLVSSTSCSIEEGAHSRRRPQRSQSHGLGSGLAVRSELQPELAADARGLLVGLEEDPAQLLGRR